MPSAILEGKYDTVPFHQGLCICGSERGWRCFPFVWKVDFCMSTTEANFLLAFSDSYVIDPLWLNFACCLWVGMQILPIKQQNLLWQQRRDVPSIKILKEESKLCHFTFTCKCVMSVAYMFCVAVDILQWPIVWFKVDIQGGPLDWGPGTTQGSKAQSRETSWPSTTSLATLLRGAKTSGRKRSALWTWAESANYHPVPTLEETEVADIVP